VVVELVRCEKGKVGESGGKRGQTHSLATGAVSRRSMWWGVRRGALWLGINRDARRMKMSQFAADW
jgi:hypothetical protein